MRPNRALSIRARWAARSAVAEHVQWLEDHDADLVGPVSRLEPGVGVRWQIESLAAEVLDPELEAEESATRPITRRPAPRVLPGMDDGFEQHDGDILGEGTSVDDEAEEQSEWVDAARRAYQVAIADFRLGRAFLVWPCVAAVVDAAFLLIDPIGIQMLGEDPDAAVEYDGVAARVWQWLCDALIESLGGDDEDEDAPSDGSDIETQGVVSFETVLAIVEQQLRAAFHPTDRVVDTEFAALIDAEFGVPVLTPCYIEPFPEAAAIARLIHARIGSFPIRWQP